MEAANQMVKKLRELAGRYNQAADVLEDGAGENEIKPPVWEHAKLGSRKTRADQIAEVIKAKGPLFAKEVLKLTKMPKGSVGVILSEKYGFKKNEDGRWNIADEKHV